MKRIFKHFINNLIFVITMTTIIVGGFLLVVLFFSLLEFLSVTFSPLVAFTIMMLSLILISSIVFTIIDIR